MLSYIFLRKIEIFIIIHFSLAFFRSPRRQFPFVLCSPRVLPQKQQDLNYPNSYGRQIETFIRNRLNHITKLKFLSAFKEAFKSTFTEQNIKSGFRATGLVLYEP
jgi:hypothetical protein